MAVTIVGAGLAGCEAAYHLAARGLDVLLLEQKPLARTPAQHSDKLCELVCSNSLRGAALINAVGLLKEELRRGGSLILAAAQAAKVPAGGALAVDRDLFSALITQELDAHPRITRRAQIVDAIPAANAEAPVVLATGPLTGDALAADLARVVGTEHLAYYDAIAPIIAADSIRWDGVFRQSRWGKGGEAGGLQDATALGDEAYVNCPFDEAGYREFVQAVCLATKVAPRDFESVRYFEGCLPFEVMAERGPLTLAFGPMKPVGLTDPRTGRRPFAVVQLRAEDAAQTAFNLVGFQTKLTYGEQLRIFRMIPGLEECEIQRFGSVHRNTFVNSPELLTSDLELKALPNVYLAGQITGVEGYVESAASGFACGVLLAAKLRGNARPVIPPETALGGLMTHVARPQPNYQPSNITWACMPPHSNPRLRKRERYNAMALRALAAFEPLRMALAGDVAHVDLVTRISATPVAPELVAELSVIPPRKPREPREQAANASALSSANGE
jgi:methylenetetrahydrofolate--tRNA-(uracil-5-)-methyltransferase